MAQNLHGIVISIAIGDPAPVFDDWGGTDVTVHATYLTQSELDSDRYQRFNQGQWISEPGSSDLLASLEGRSVIIEGPEGSEPVSSGGTATLQFELTEEEYSDPGVIFMWASPLGAVTLKAEGIGLPAGLLKVYDLAQYKKTTPMLTPGGGLAVVRTISFHVELFISVTSFTINHIINRNHGGDDFIDSIREGISNSNTREGAIADFGGISAPENQRTMLLGSVDLPDWAAHTAANVYDGTAGPDGNMYSPPPRGYDGALDLKPEIRALFGNYNTVGNNGKIYRADVFSNTSWGYTGQYVGLTANELVRFQEMDPNSVSHAQDNITTPHGVIFNEVIGDPPENSELRRQLFAVYVRFLDTYESWTAIWAENSEGNN